MARTFLTQIALPNDPTTALQAATKQYVDNAPPTPHAATHASGGSDPVSPASIGAVAQARAAGLALVLGN